MGEINKANNNNFTIKKTFLKILIWLKSTMENQDSSKLSILPHTKLHVKAK